jgi:outer membrane receptor protein involved in Fe transport
VNLSRFPQVAVSQMIALGSKASNHDRDRSWVFNEALTLSKGRHSLKFGGDFRRQMYNNYSPGKLSGSYTFGNTFTSISPNDTKSGFGLADLLLGMPAASSFAFNDYTYRLNINSAGAFVQDDFKILRNLTLNLGLHGRGRSLPKPTTSSPNPRSSIKPRESGDAFAGRWRAGAFLAEHLSRFSPRIGFAWSFQRDTVLRGGYGITACRRSASRGWAGLPAARSSFASR